MKWLFIISKLISSHNLLKNPRCLIGIRTAVDLAHKIHGPKPTGQNSPIIILHGLMGSKKNWESMSKKLSSSTKKSVIAVDARNHGDSPHENSHTYLDLASDVSQLMTKLLIREAIFIGHSMGGRTAMVLALVEPPKVSSLIVVDISPVSTAGLLNDFFPRLLEVMKSINFHGVDNVVKARGLAKEKLISADIVDHPESLNFILMNINIRPDKSIGWMVNVDLLNKYFTTIATFPTDEMAGKQYLGNTLFIGGEMSNYIPREDLTGIRNYYPKAELKYVSGVGHNVHAEDPTTFFKTVTEFLAKT